MLEVCGLDTKRVMIVNDGEDEDDEDEDEDDA